MQTLLVNIPADKDRILLSALDKRLHLKSRLLTEEEIEDIGLLNAMEEGKKSGKATENEIMEILNKWK